MGQPYPGRRDREHRDKGPAHQRKELGNRKGHVEDQPLHAGVTVRHQEVEGHHRDDEQDERGLCDGGEQRASAYREYRGDAADHVEGPESEPETGFVTGEREDRTQHRQATGEQHRAPPRNPGCGGKCGLLIEGNPRARARARNHMSTVPVNPEKPGNEPVGSNCGEYR